jgi:hypothetical protein
MKLRKNASNILICVALLVIVCAAGFVHYRAEQRYLRIVHDESMRGIAAIERTMLIESRMLYQMKNYYDLDRAVRLDRINVGRIKATGNRQALKAAIEKLDFDIVKRNQQVLVTRFASTGSDSHFTAAGDRSSANLISWLSLAVLLSSLYALCYWIGKTARRIARENAVCHKA